MNQRKSTLKKYIYIESYDLMALTYETLFLFLASNKWYISFKITLFKRLRNFLI